jgi:hypothetical protein
MSLIDLALLPIRVGLGVADAVLKAVTPEAPSPPSELVVINGMPEGVPPAALRPEPHLPAPAAWPFGEDFPRTCGTSRFAGGAHPRAGEGTPELLVRSGAGRRADRWRRDRVLAAPEQARLVVDQAPHNAVDAIHTLSLIMAVGPIAAIILVLWLIRPTDAR